MVLIVDSFVFLIDVWVQYFIHFVLHTWYSLFCLVEYWWYFLLFCFALDLYAYGCFVCMCACVPHSCLVVPMEIRQKDQIPWNWNCRWLWATLGVLKIEPRFSCKSKCSSPLSPLPSLPPYNLTKKQQTNLLFFKKKKAFWLYSVGGYAVAIAH